VATLVLLLAGSGQSEAALSLLARRLENALKGEPHP
jgi:hypothetical protein